MKGAKPRPPKEAHQPGIKGHPGACARGGSQAPKYQSPLEGRRQAEQELPS